MTLARESVWRWILTEWTIEWTLFIYLLFVLGLSHHLMTTPNSTISEPHKHLTIAKAYIAWQIAPWWKRHIWVWSVSDVSSRIRVQAALPCWPPWSTYPMTVDIICPKWNAYKLLFRSYSLWDEHPKDVIPLHPSWNYVIFTWTIDKNLLYKNPLFPKRNRCRIWKNSPPKFAIFALRNFQTTIVFVANAHAHVSQTGTAHVHIVKIDFPYGFSPISPT